MRTLSWYCKLSQCGLSLVHILAGRDVSLFLFLLGHQSCQISIHPMTYLILIISMKALKRFQHMNLRDTIQATVGLDVQTLIWSPLTCHPAQQNVGGLPYSLTDADN